MKRFLYNKYLFALLKNTKYSVFIILSIFILSSCSGADPIILRLETRVQAYWRYPFEITERLLVQIEAADDDGFEEIYEVYIINDEQEKYWRVTKDQWDVVVGQDSKHWIVITDIETEDGSNIPRGNYRVVLLDFSGYRDERAFELKQPEIEYTQQDFPTLATQNASTFVPVLVRNEANQSSKLILELSYPSPLLDVAGNEDEEELRNSISFLGGDGVFYEVNQGVPIRFVLNENARAEVYLHSESNDGILYTSGPYTLNFKKTELIPESSDEE